MKEHCLGEDVKHTGISEGDKFVGRGFQGMLGFLMELHERELGGTGTAEREMLWVTPAPLLQALSSISLVLSSGFHSMFSTNVLWKLQKFKE